MTKNQGEWNNLEVFGIKVSVYPGLAVTLIINLPIYDFQHPGYEDWDQVGIWSTDAGNIPLSGHHGSMHRHCISWPTRHQSKIKLNWSHSHRSST